MQKIVGFFKANQSKIMTLFWSVLLPTSFIGLFLICIAFYGGNHNVGEVFSVLFSNELIHPTSISTQEISRSIWIILSMIVGGMGLAVAGAVSQSLTRNPLADASTLGTISSTTFMIIVSLSIGIVAFWFQYIFAIIGGIISAVLLVLIAIFAKGKLNKTKLILAGLALSISFKTLSFFFWKEDKGIGSAFAAYTLGGAEQIYGTQTFMDNPWLTLLVSSILIIVGSVIALVNAKGMAVVELGDDKAKGLGISVTRVRLLNISSLILIIPSSVLIVGNLAFIGLIATHLVRILFKTIDYRKIIPIVMLIGMTISLTGLTLNILIPTLTSSIWTTIFGAPLLIYLAWRRL